MANITSQAKVKRSLGIPTGITMHDTYIDELLEVADQQIIAYCGMSAITNATVTEQYDIPTRYENEVVLQGFPVVSVASVLVAGTTLNTSTYYVTSQTGVLKLTDSSKFFSEGRRKVNVTYTYGVGATAPADLQHAATIITCFHFNTSGHAGFLQEAAGGYRYKIDDYSLPPTAAAILARYRRVFPKEEI